MSVVSTTGTFSEKKAAYAAWRERMRSGVQANKVIDLTVEEPAPADEGWAADGLFVASEQPDEADDLLDELAE